MPHRSRHIIAIALAAAFVSILAGCGSNASTASAPRGHELISIFESGPQLRASPAATLDHLRRLGVDVVKVFVPWEEVAPDPNSRVPPAGFDATNPAAYSALAWEPWDAIVRDATARGLAVDLTVSKPPLWAARAGAPPGIHPQWRPSPRDFEAFMRAIGTRYSGHYKPPGSSTAIPRVTYWSIWNEPNFGPNLAPQAIDGNTVEVSPAVYRHLADAEWTALQATGHGHDTILLGETAPRGTLLADSPGDFGGMVPLRFIRALYCVDATLRPLRGVAATARRCPSTAAGSQRFQAANPVLFEATGFADHPYGQGYIPPNVVTPEEPDYADLPTIPRLTRMLDRIFSVYGSSRRLPIYSTEFGYQTDPPERNAGATVPNTAALYLNWAEYISWRNPRIASFDQYQLVDPARANAAGGFASGLEYKNGVPKATYFAYRMPIFLPLQSFSHGQSLEVWGCVRPARFARLQTGRVQQVRIEFRPASAQHFRVLRTIDLGGRYFDTRVSFPSSGTVRTAWTYPDRITIRSRPVSVTLR